MLLLIPIGVSVTFAFVRGVGGLGVCLALVGSGTAFCLFAVLVSGIETTNWGTYFRRREPIRFWIGAAVLIVGYLGLCAAGFVGTPKKPASPPAPHED